MKKFQNKILMTKKIVLTFICVLFFNSIAYSKIEIKKLEKNENFIILKYSSSLELKQNKLLKILKKTMTIAKEHCNSFKKNAYWFAGYTHGNDNQTEGIYMLDSDMGKTSKTYLHRIICSKDLQGALKLFKNRVTNYDTDLSLDTIPESYFVNSLENRKKIPSTYKTMDTPKDEKKEIDKKKDTNKSFVNPRDNAERVAALSFYRIECGHLTSKGKNMLSAQKSNMDQSVYRATQRNLSDLVIVEGIDKTCNMLFGVLKPQSLVQ